MIAERAKDGDIVVTADVPLAVRCVGAGALVTGPTGRVFDETNIGMASAMRDLSAHLRRPGKAKATTPPSPPATAPPFSKRLTDSADG